MLDRLLRRAHAGVVGEGAGRVVVVPLLLLLLMAVRPSSAVSSAL
jgi:hypothetical protein